MSDLAHSAINVFAGGRSSTKVYLFFLYLLLLTVLVYLIKRDLLRVQKLSRHFVLASIFLGYFLGVTLFFIFTDNLGVSSRNYVITFNNQEISSTQLSHNHLLKGAVGVFLKTFGLGKFENIDAGLPFVGLFSNTWLWTGSIIILIAILSVVIFFVSTIYTKGNLRQKIFYTLAFSLSSFAAIKAIPDGGIFLNKTIPILISFIFVIDCQRKKLMAVSLAVLYLVWYLIVIFLDLNPTNLDITQYLISGIIPALIIFILYYLSMFDKFKRLHILLIILAVVIISWPVYSELSVTRNYTSITAKGGLIATYESDSITSVLKYKVGTLKISEIVQQKTIGEILNKEKIIDNIYPVAVPWETCIPTADGDKYKFNLIGNHLDKPTEVEHSLPITEYKENLIDERNGYIFYEVSITLLPCMPRHLNILQEILRQKFAEPFFIYNLTTN